MTSSWDNIVAPNYRTFPTATGFHYTMSVPGAYQNPTPQGFYSPSHLSTSTDISHMVSVTSYAATRTGSENPPDELQVSDKEFAQIKAEIILSGLLLRAQRQRVANPSLVSRKSRKRRGPPLADPGPGATNTIGGKKRKTKEGKETGVGQASQRGDTQELPTGGTQTNQKQNPSGLDMETLVVPQGVSSLLMLGPTIAGATPGLHKYTSQAWTEGTRGESDPQEEVGTEDAHDEEETDRERWERLMRHADGVWRCVGCGGQAFSDRATLQRHCKSAAHRKQRDLQKCPFCPKKYLRLSNLTRHMDQKHEGAAGEESKRLA